MKEFGEGIDRICSELETKGFAIPTFHVDAFILKATLKAEWTSEKEMVGTINDTINDTINVPVNVPVNTPNLASVLGVSEKTIKRDIAAMQSAGIIKRVGSDKTGHWEIIDNK